MEAPGQTKICRVIPSEDGSLRAGLDRKHFSWAIVSPAGAGMDSTGFPAKLFQPGRQRYASDRGRAYCCLYDG